MGWTGASEGCTVYGDPRRHALQPYDQGVLRATVCRRQAEEGGFGGLHAQAAAHPRRDPQKPHPLEVSSCPSPLTSKTVAFFVPSSVISFVACFLPDHQPQP